MTLFSRDLHFWRVKGTGKPLRTRWQEFSLSPDPGQTGSGVREIGLGAHFSKVFVFNNLRGDSLKCDSLLGVGGSGSSIANSSSVVGNLAPAFKWLKSQNIYLGLASSRVSGNDIYGGSLSCKNMTPTQRSRLASLRFLGDERHLNFGQPMCACIQSNSSCSP